MLAADERESRLTLSSHYPGAALRRRVSGERMERIFVKTSGITAALPALDLERAKNFYIEKVGLQALESHLL